MQIRKSIAYCYPTSPNAKKLGVYKTGGWYVQQYAKREDGEWGLPYIASQDVFDRPNDPDLVALYHEFRAEPCPMFLRHGHPLALAAIVAI